ncbi:MAG: O-antigen ligase family protein [Clostridia bacterium]|nr:O-antigen ligase family protein [Clostridia bacterium]
MKKYTLSRLLDGYDAPDKNKQRKFISKTISGNATLRRGKYSPMRYISAASNTLAYLSSRSYALMLLVYGVLTLIVQFVKNSLPVGAEGGISALIIGMALTFASIPFFLSEKALAVALQDNVATDYIFFEFFRIKRTDRSRVAILPNPVLSVLIGALPALLSIIVPAHVILLSLSALLLAWLSLVSPEFALFFTILLLPLAHAFPYGVYVLVALEVTATLSFARKLYSGKRTYNLEQYDVMLGLMLLSLIISGIFLGGIASFLDAATMLLLALGYLLASNLITNRHLAECCFTAVSLSSLAPSVMAVVQFITLSVREGGTANFEICGPFVREGELVTFLTVSIIVSVTLANDRRGRGSAVLFSLCALLCALATGLALSLAPVFTIVLIIIFSHFAKKYKHSVTMLGFVYILLHFILLLPVEWIAGALEFIRVNPAFVLERRELLLMGFDIVRDNFLLGVGIGAQTFREVTASLVGLEYDNTRNLLLQLAAEGGVAVSLVFVLIVCIRFRHIRIYTQYISRSTIKRLSFAMNSTILAFLFMGVWEYVFSSPANYALFWIIFGAGSAMLRIAKLENDEREGYFTDLGSHDFSSLDVKLK